jgi:hypothetical protein
VAFLSRDGPAHLVALATYTVLFLVFSGCASNRKLTSGEGKPERGRTWWEGTLHPGPFNSGAVVIN